MKRWMAPGLCLLVGALAGAGDAATMLDWRELPELPDELGVAGPFDGVSAGALIVAGGANFPRPEWDNEHGGMLYFVDIKGLPVQEYWHDMKFWWPQNETIIATLLAYHLTGDEKVRRMASDDPRLDVRAVSGPRVR